MRLEVLDLGLVEYDAAWAFQEVCAQQIVQGMRPPTLMLLEHHHVYTLGRSGNADNVLWDEEERRKYGVTLRWVDRGGDVTYHGPGQLVGYPLLTLGGLSIGSSPGGTDSAEYMRIPRADYVGYLRRLERSLILALAHMGIAAAQIPGLTGVWVQPDVFSRCSRCRPEDRSKPAKIAAIGVKVDSRGVTRHGFALNICPDMTYWNGIIPCGLADHPVVSVMDLLSAPPGMDQAKQLVASAFGEVFGYSVVLPPRSEVGPQPISRTLD